MKKMIFGCLMLVTTTLFAANLDPQQEHVKIVAEVVGKQNCVNKVCFDKTLQAIAWQESSFGNKIHAKTDNPVYYFKDGKNIVFIKQDEVQDTKTKYYWRRPVSQSQFAKTYSQNRTSDINKVAIGPFQIKLATAKRVIEEMKLKKFYALLNNERALVSQLLNDSHFGATIAANYLKMNYIHAKKKGSRDPWFFAVSKYNGGANNHTYVGMISNKIKKL